MTWILFAGTTAIAKQNQPLKVMPVEIKKLVYEVADYSYASASDASSMDSTFHTVETRSDLYVIDAEHLKPRKLISAARNPAWSPDGSQLAYCTWKGVGFGQIQVVNADGTGKRQITNMKGGACFPHWSPDGTKIVFTALTKGDKERNLQSARKKEIFIVDRDGGNPQPVGPGLAAWWSPRGDMLLILRDKVKHGPEASLWVASPDGSNARLIAITDGQIQSATWSPDGTAVAASVYRDRRNSIFCINLDDTRAKDYHAHKILDSGYNLYDPNLSPDGKLIAITGCKSPFSGWGSCLAGAIVFTDTHTGKSETLAAGENYSVVWSKK